MNRYGSWTSQDGIKGDYAIETALETVKRARERGDTPNKWDEYIAGIRTSCEVNPIGSLA